MTKGECLQRVFQIIKKKKEHYLHNHSLLSGSAGVLLFLVYLNESKLENTNQLVDELVDLILDQLNFENIRYSDGACGILWVLKHIEKNMGYDFKANCLIKQLADQLLDHKEILIKEPSLDLLHGLLGLQSLTQELESHPINELIDELVVQYSIQTSQGIFWYESLGSEERIINTSLAHGQASMLIYLASRIQFKKGTKKGQFISMLKSAIEFYDSIELKDSISLYPSIVIKNQFSTPSRLAWCYGDLGIALAQLYAASILKDEVLKMKAISIAINSSKRKKEEHTGIKDQGFCHGSAGLSQLYSYFYRLSGIKVFDQSADFWMNHTLRNLFKEEMAYKAFRVEDGFQESYGLLDGLAGIGLCLIGNIHSHLNRWEEVFYLRS